MKHNWEESSSERFKDISAREVLEWLEEASQFMRRFYKPGEMIKIHEKKEGNEINVRRTK